MKRMLIPIQSLKSLVKELVLKRGHADELLHGDSTPNIHVFIDEEGAHVMMPNVRGKHDPK